MLKVKSLNMIDGLDLTAEELALPAVAVVKVKDQEVHGTVSFKNDGMNTVATVLAGGTIEEVAALNPSDIKVEVRKTLKREAEVKKDDTKINTGLGASVLSAKVDGTAVDSAKLSDGVITINAAAEDHTAELELVVKVAEGAAEDSDVKEDSTGHLMAEAGPIHFSMICEVKHHPCSKHSKTRCSVRGRKPWKVTGEDGPIHLK